MLESGKLFVSFLYPLLIELMLGLQVFVDPVLFEELRSLAFKGLDSLRVSAFPFTQCGLSFPQEVGHRHQFVDASVAFRQGPFQLLDGAAMGGLAITQFNFQMVDAVLGRFQLLHLGAEPISIGQALVELGDLFTEDADFFFQNFAGLFSALRGLVGSSKVLGLGFRMSIELTDLPVAVGEGLFELLDGAAMGGFAITQFNFQLVDTVL